MCKFCETKPVYVLLNHKKLCKSCFIKYFEKKVLRTIRTQKMIDKKDKVVMALSGGKDSVTTAHIINKILQRKGETLTAICIDEGIPNYRKKTINSAKKFCKKEGIKLNVTSSKQQFGFTLTQALKKLKINPCTICGALRRYILNKKARKLKATKLVTGHNLDDESQTVLMNQMKGNMQLSAKLGPVTGALTHKKFIKRIKPLYFMTEKEVTIYTILKNFPVDYEECPNSRDSFRTEVRDLLNNMENKFPGTKQGIINAFLGILPELKKKFKSKGISTCTLCNEPSAKTTCSMCNILNKYYEKKPRKKQTKKPNHTSAHHA